MTGTAAPQETRDRLLTAARTVISRSGLRAARMEDIAAEAGVSRAAVYYHFSSKDELAAALVDDIFRGLVATARTALADGPIEHLIHATVEFFGRQATVARLLLAEMPPVTDPERVIGRHRDELVGVIRDRLASDMRAGRIRRCDPGVAAAALAQLLRVAPVEMLLHGRTDLDWFVRELCSFVQHALAPQPPDAAAPDPPTPDDPAPSAPTRT